MGLKQWLKGATRIRFDDRTLGNLTKNAGVVGGTLVGGPLGLAIGAGAGALGQAALPGANIGDIAGAGFKGAANTGLAQAGKGIVSKAIGSGAPAAPGMSAGMDASGAIAPPPVPTNGLPLPEVPNLTSAGPGPGFLSKALNTGKSALDWAATHDKTSSAVLSGLGDALDPTEERLQRAQAQSLERQNAESEYDYNQRKARDLAMEPLRQALYGSFGQGYQSIAPNPYAPKVG